MSHFVGMAALSARSLHPPSSLAVEWSPAAENQKTAENAIQNNNWERPPFPGSRSWKSGSKIEQDRDSLKNANLSNLN